jgi:hypothetical protein
MSEKIYSNSEIVAFIEEEFGEEGASAVGRLIGVERQSVSNFASKGKIDINNKIISLLISRIKTGAAGHNK